MQLDFQRYECKYIIPAGLRSAIREHIACYTRPDKYTAKSPTGGYLITSLYLDSPYLTFHQAKSRKDLNRMKLRIRIYDNQSDGPVFFEIKRKIKGIIQKRRVMVQRRDWPRFMDGGTELLDAATTARDAGALQEFLALKDRFLAFPAVLVKYAREAYQGEIDDYSRVTFDSRLMCLRPSGYVFAAGVDGWDAIDGPLALERYNSGVVLELKFANRAPLWMVDVVQRFGLQLRGFSKYSTSIDQLLSTCRGIEDIRVPRRLTA